MSPARTAVLRDMLVLDVSKIVNSVNIVPDVISRDLNFLERALQEKGNDSKNDIRKCLKKFFKERECCTIIRPLTNEDEL